MDRLECVGWSRIINQAQLAMCTVQCGAGCNIGSIAVPVAADSSWADLGIARFRKVDVKRSMFPLSIGTNAQRDLPQSVLRDDLQWQLLVSWLLCLCGCVHRMSYAPNKTAQVFRQSMRHSIRISG